MFLDALPQQPCLDTGGRHKRLLRQYQSSMAARSCPYGQDGPPEMAKVGLPGKAGILRHNLRHTAGRDHLASAGKPRARRLRTSAKERLPLPRKGLDERAVSTGPSDPLR